MKIKIEAGARLTAAVTKAQARANAKTCIKELYAEMQASMPEVFGEMPQVPLQNDEGSLKRACKAGLKANNEKVVKLARQAYGFLVVAEVVTPF